MDTAWISKEISSWDFNKLMAQITGNVGNVGNALGKVVDATTSFFGVAVNALMGFIIAIYVLLSKNSLSRQCKKCFMHIYPKSMPIKYVTYPIL